MSQALRPDQTPELQQSLLQWAGARLRPLPWRTVPRDPYAVWISEIMLQQTRVGTVIPYFERWMRRFPDVQALAAAPLAEVLKAWEGLGYYARARNLHAAARIVVSEHGGRLPDTRAGLQRLPGVGRYTVGAILSIAYGQDEPLLDGNVRRVLSRLFAVGEPNRVRLDSTLWEIAGRLLPRGQAGPFNEALMELGATICVPRAPLCAECPWTFACAVRAEGRQEAYPARQPRRKVPHHEVTAAVIWNGEGQFLVAQRAADGLLGGLWEFPGGKVEQGESLEQCLRREIEEELGVRICVGEPLTIVKHAYTHFRITLHAFHARTTEGEGVPRAIGCADWRWIRLEEASALAFSAADLRILEALRGKSSPFGRS